MGECYLHTVEVTGSNPVPPTSKFKRLQIQLSPLFYYLLPFISKMVLDGPFEQGYSADISEIRLKGNFK